MSTECCGKEVVTPYCGQCGKKVVDVNGLDGLLLHVRQRVRALARSLDGQMKELKASDGVFAEPEKDAQLKKTENAHHKWLCWEEELEKLIEAE